MTAELRAPHWSPVAVAKCPTGVSNLWKAGLVAAHSSGGAVHVAERLRRKEQEASGHTAPTVRQQGRLVLLSNLSPLYSAHESGLWNGAAHN